MFISQSNNYNNNMFNHYNSLFIGDKNKRFMNKINNTYTNKYTDEEIANMLESFCITDRFSLIIPYGMEDIVFAYLTPAIVNRYSNIVVMCKGELKFYHGTTPENVPNILSKGFNFKSRVDNPESFKNMCDDVIYVFKEDKLDILLDKYPTLLEISYNGVYYQALEQQDYDERLVGECILSNVFIIDIKEYNPNSTTTTQTSPPINTTFGATSPPINTTPVNNNTNISHNLVTMPNQHRKSYLEGLNLTTAQLLDLCDQLNILRPSGRTKTGVIDFILENIELRERMNALLNLDLSSPFSHQEPI